MNPFYLHYRTLRRLEDVGEMLLESNPLLGAGSFDREREVRRHGGRESYTVVSAFDQFEYKDEAPLFRRLAENFELCVFGLNLVKQDLERLQRQYYRGLQKVLEG